MSLPLVLFVLRIVVIFLVKGVWSAFGKYQLATAALADERRSYERTKAHKEELEASILKLSTGRGVEESLRSTFQVVKPGEEIVIVVAEEPTTTTSSHVTVPVVSVTASTTPVVWWRHLLPF